MRPCNRCAPASGRGRGPRYLSRWPPSHRDSAARTTCAPGRRRPCLRRARCCSDGTASRNAWARAAWPRSGGRTTSSSTDWSRSSSSIATCCPTSGPASASRPSRAVAGLSHPGIVTVHDIVVDDQHAAMVLELVDGEPLSDTITIRGRLPEVAAASITAQVAYALQAAHDRGLVHRDVKPANVLVSPDGRARLVDFGIARALDDRDGGLTLPGTIMGTLRYMAPEQLADGAADRATDVFGLGSLLYEMLVARPPFPAATPAALMAQQRQGAPSIFGASPELASLARMALQHDPERRPRTAGRMAALVERWLENRGVSSADLPAVAMASLFGGPMPRPAPMVLPVPAITPAPIIDPVSAVSAVSAPPPMPIVAAPKVTKRRTKKADPPAGEPVLFPPAALAEAAATVAPASLPMPVTGTPDPAPLAAVVAAASPRHPASPAHPCRPPAALDTAVIIAPGGAAPAGVRPGRPSCPIDRGGGPCGPPAGRSPPRRRPDGPSGRLRATGVQSVAVATRGHRAGRNRHARASADTHRETRPDPGLPHNARQGQAKRPQAARRSGELRALEALPAISGEANDLSSQKSQPSQKCVAVLRAALGCRHGRQDSSRSTVVHRK